MTTPGWQAIYRDENIDDAASGCLLPDIRRARQIDVKANADYYQRPISPASLAAMRFMTKPFILRHYSLPHRGFADGNIPRRSCTLLIGDFCLPIPVP